MLALYNHSNVYSESILLLEEWGYQVWYDKEAELFAAEKQGWDFWADDPTALLGLAAIHRKVAPDIWREYWWRRQPQNLRSYLQNLRRSPVRSFKSIADGQEWLSDGT
ncbi:MAG: hypothetical protein AAF663_03990 [Planctomycetota bacterium]